ncbi:MAG: outer membrane protein assembly factor BamA [Phycisphaerae bacterium]|nr:outer membrane protein assembly factor BamA [Phycisphaerae bacterium]
MTARSVPTRLAHALLRVLALAMLLLMCVPASAQNIEDATLIDRPVSKILFVGLDRVTEQEVRNNIRMASGQPFDAKAVKDDVANLYRLGHFDVVRADAELQADGTVHLTYRMEEQPLVQDIQVIGNTIVSDQELRKEIGLYAGAPRDDFLLERAVTKIKDLYRGRGHYLSEVTVDESELKENGILIFRIIEGPRTRVRSIEFTGNLAFPAKRLQEEIQTKEWVFLFSKGDLDEDRLAGDVAALDRFYKGQGYVDVRVDRRVDVAPDGNEAKVVFAVEEGRQYRLRNVTILDLGDETAPTLSNEQALGLLKIRPGDAFLETLVKQSVDSVRGAYQVMGHGDAIVQSEWVRTGESPEVDLVLKVREGSATIAGIVRIQGNNLTKDNVIRRDIKIDPGRPLDARQLDDATKRLERTGLFGDVRLTLQQPDAQDQGVRDILVEIKEQNTGSLNFGVGASTDTGLFGQISLTQRNFDLFDTPRTLDEFLAQRAFRGAGQTFNATISPGVEVSNYAVGISDPRLFDSDWGGGINGFFRTRVYEDWTEERWGPNLQISRRLGDLWTFSGRLNWNRVELTDFDASTPTMVYREQGPYDLDSLTFSFTRTNTDNVSRPSRGTRIEGSVQQYGVLGGDYTYTAINGEWTGFFTLAEDLIGRRSVLKTTVQSGYIFDDEAPLTERFYLGGRTFRGFEFRSVSPKSASSGPPGSTTPTVNAQGQADGDPIGGTFKFFAGAQYEMPLIDEFVNWVAFCDSGTVVDEVALSDYRLSIGIGLRLYLPQFGPIPLAFDFAQPILKDDTDQTQVFSFSADLPF